MFARIVSCVECGEYSMEDDTCFSFTCPDGLTGSCLPIPENYLPSYFESIVLLLLFSSSLYYIGYVYGGLHVPSSRSHFCVPELRNAHLRCRPLVVPL